MTAVLRNGLQRRPLAGRCNACAANFHVSLGGVAPLIGEPGPSGTLAADCALTSHFAAGDLWVVRAHSAEQVHPQLAELGRRTEASVSAAERSAPGRSRHIRCLPRHAQPSGEPYKQQVPLERQRSAESLDVVARCRCGLSPPRTTVRLEVGTNSMRCVCRLLERLPSQPSQVVGDHAAGAVDAVLAADHDQIMSGWDAHRLGEAGLLCSSVGLR